MAERRDIAVIGGGAAGFFAAIACAESKAENRATLYEATAHLLAKVKISGGGRCNVTHACFEPRQLATRYPRGGRELLGAFSRFQPRDTVAWFESRGVTLKTEDDGRMFPVTDDSQTIVDCLVEAARKAGVNVRTHCGVKSARRVKDGGFELALTTGESTTCRRLIVATGGNRSNLGFEIARSFGHTIEPPVPSLFTFHVDDARLKDLSGVSVEEASTAVPGDKLKEHGPLLITHWGLSGPAVLKLSAWGARALHARDYRFPLHVNWAPRFNAESARAELARAREANPRKHAGTWSPFGLPLRLWERLIAAAQIPASASWAGIGNSQLRALAAQVCDSEFQVTGKSLFKDEFVTCGGVRLGEVDFRTMESKLAPGLHFAGEVLDIDGVTGGFNFQAAWTTGYLAGRAAASP
jgi:predicted Rossmann fold flavoprotein